MNLDSKGGNSQQRIKPAASLPNKGLPTELMEDFANNALSTSFSGATFEGGARDILLAEDVPLSASFSLAKGNPYGLGTSQENQGGKELDNFKMMSLDGPRGGS